MAGGLKPAPSKAGAVGATTRVGRAECAWCGFSIFRARSQDAWGNVGTGNRSCMYGPGGRHDASKVPDLQDPDELNRWLESP